MSESKDEPAGSTTSSTLGMGSVHLMFFLSGAASLICQVVWFKQLIFVLGSSTFAVSVTVSTFFLGLSLGSWQGGRLADRVARPLVAYGLLELGLSVVSLAITLLLSRWASWVPMVAPLFGRDTPAAGIATVAVSVAVLLPPTALMGATLPLLVKYLVREQADLAERIGLLYGINTLGAVFGCATVGLILIGTLGVIQSSGVASVIYLVIAGLAAWLVTRTGSAAALHRSAELAGDAELESSPGDSERARRVLVLVMVFAVSGFIAIAYEVLWFRVLANFNLHTVYAFSAMLSTYLLGLVLGALICARYLARNKEKLLEYFATLQLLIALAGTITLVMLGRSRNFFEALAGLKEWAGISETGLAALGSSLEIAAICLIILLVPTTLIGVGFPLASELTIQHLSGLGKRIGRLYALNTAGGTLGSLAAGFVLLPLLGSQWSLTLIIALNGLLFVTIMVTQPTLRGTRRLWRLGAEVLLVVGVCLAIIGPNYLAGAQSNFLGGEVLAFHEARDATFVVMGYESPEAGAFQQLLVNGRSYANNAPPGRRYMALLAHLPTFIHASPKSALIACVGTGTTVGSLTTHASLQTIDAVDLSPEVFEFAPFFVPINHSFHQEPRVKQVVADARHYLLGSDRRFDVITFEPPPPQDAGVVNLYSREFYELASERLETGGVVAQWIPLDLERRILPLMMIQSMRSVFPHVSLWISNRMEGIVVGSEQPLQIDLEVWRTRMAEPGVAADLLAVGIDSPEDLAATFIAADAALERLVGEVPEVSDNHPRIEYFSFYPYESMRYDWILARAEPIERYLVSPPRRPESLDTARVLARSIWLEHEAMVLGDHEAAKRHVDQGLALDPENRYLRYLAAYQKRDR